jgi:hypothetical protein
VQQRPLAHLVDDTQRLERAQGVGPQRQSGTDLAELPGLLQDLDLPPHASEGQGCRETADAPTHDDGLLLGRHPSTLEEPRDRTCP